MNIFSNEASHLYKTIKMPFFARNGLSTIVAIKYRLLKLSNRLMYISTGAKILPDFFLEDLDPEALVQHIEKAGGKAAFKATGVPASGPAGTFAVIKGALSEDMCKQVGGVFAFDLKGTT